MEQYTITEIKPTAKSVKLNGNNQYPANVNIVPHAKVNKIQCHDIISLREIAPVKDIPKKAPAETNNPLAMSALINTMETLLSAAPKSPQNNKKIINKEARLILLRSFGMAKYRSNGNNKSIHPLVLNTILLSASKI